MCSIKTIDLLVQVDMQFRTAILPKDDVYSSVSNESSSTEQSSAELSKFNEQAVQVKQCTTYVLYFVSTSVLLIVEDL